MTLLYIHGVKVRSPQQGLDLQKPFARWVLPKLGAKAEYYPVYWGDVAADFRWNLASRPQAKDAAKVAPYAGEPTVRSKSLFGESAPSAAATLAQIPLEKRADFLADLYTATHAAGMTDGALAVKAAETAEQWDALIAGATDEAAQAHLLLLAMDDAALRLADKGAFDGNAKLKEALARLLALPGDAVSTALSQVRGTLNDFAAPFLGDVLTYVANRTANGQPGKIPVRVLDALRAAQARKRATGEPIVVVTHSMGGQLLYDAVTAFADADADLQTLVVDHWISCGAQVSFFAELGLFLGQPNTRAPAKLARPARVKAWTNFYDPNDYLGFIMAPVFDGVADREYDTGYGVALAHTGYLARPSFYEAIAKVLPPAGE